MDNLSHLSSCISQADNIVLKERKLNIAPAIKKTVCVHMKN